MRNRIIRIIAITIMAFMFTTNMVSASVSGITKDNYIDHVKKNADAYGYNVGECDKPYLEGEEYFYNDYIDHWNVDKVYDKALIPADWNQKTKVTTKTTTVKKAKAKIKVSKKDKRLIVKFCKKHYGKRSIRIVKEGKVPTNRKSKKYVYVEKMKTVSMGNGWGRAKSGIIKYNKTVKQGKKVKVYSVWNPKNNVIDDVTAVICQGKIR